MRKVDERIQRITDLIRERLAPERISLFGSRAKGDAAVGSDIDIAIEGISRLSLREERKFKEELDEIAGLYSVDLMFLDDMRDYDMIKVVRETGVVLYEKK